MWTMMNRMHEHDDNAAFATTVSEAQRGDSLSMTCLAEEAEKRLRAYLYRLTLDHDLTEELLQQTLLKMVESLGELRSPELFWPWLFRTALGHVQHHYRAEKQRSRTAMSVCNRERVRDRLAEMHDDGLTFASRKELLGTIFHVMSQMKFNYRNVVVLRCIEGMSYEEIADVLNCKEFHARVLFFRARNALRRQLTRRGYREGFLLTALGLFKLATGHAPGIGAAGSVQAACLDVGALAAVVGSVGTRVGVIVATCFGFVAAATTLKIFLCVAGLIVFVLICASVTYYLELLGPS